MAEMIFQNCKVYITIADPKDLKISQDTRIVTTKAGETSIIIQKQEKALSPAEIIKADPAHVELVDIKCVVDKTFLTREALTNDNEWLSCTEAAREFKFSDAFFWYLSTTVPGLKKPDSVHCLLNREALKRYFKAHPEHRANQSRKYLDLEGSIQKAMDILKQDRKEMYPDRTVPKAIKNNYYTQKQMVEKLGVGYSYFNRRILPILCERIKTDADYIKLVLDARADEKRSIDSMVERCIELIDREGRPFRSYQGMLPDPGNYMSAKELAERMEIPYAFFNQKIKPQLEGKTDDRDAVKFAGEINEWKKTAELSV